MNRTLLTSNCKGLNIGPGRYLIFIDEIQGFELHHHHDNNYLKFDLCSQGCMNSCRGGYFQRFTRLQSISIDSVERYHTEESFDLGFGENPSFGSEDRIGYGHTSGLQIKVLMNLFNNILKHTMLQVLKFGVHASE